MIAAVQPSRPDFVFLTGWEAALAPMLAIGCQGGTNASSGIVPEVTRKIYDLTTTGRLPEACRLQLKFLPLFDAMLAIGNFPDGFRAGVELRGFKVGSSRQPVGNVPPIDRDKLQRMIQSLLGELN
jgi:2-dehydro-3-deoxy-D-pentonate aldolase